MFFVVLIIIILLLPGLSALALGDTNDRQEKEDPSVVPMPSANDFQPTFPHVLPPVPGSDD